VPVLYEAYYPEPRDWPASGIPKTPEPLSGPSPRANLEEIRKLRELTNRLLREEEELGRLAERAVAIESEKTLEPRARMLGYVLSEPPRGARLWPVSLPAPDDVQVASLTVSDVGKHRVRHHHGEANRSPKRLPSTNR
jgi:N-glycosylase/DNA lyase